MAREGGGRGGREPLNAIKPVVVLVQLFIHLQLIFHSRDDDALGVRSGVHT